jgi:glycosyltransferase involved in cell wall biosynthesis
MKQKVFHVVPVNKTGGVENAAKSSAEKLNIVFEFKILYLIDSVKNNGLLKLIFGILGTIKFLKNENNYILISSLWKSVFVPLILKFFFRKKFKWIHFIHSKSFFSLVDMFINITAIRLSDEVLADSISSSEKRQNLTNKSIKVISFKLFNDVKMKRKKIGGKLKFMFLGRISKVKNLSLSITIIEKLFLNGYNVILDIYGPKEDDYNHLVSLVNKKNLNDIVNFKSELKSKEVKDVFDNYNFYLQTSNSEGMGMSVVEAMMNGLVCLIKPVGEMKNYSEDMISAIHLKSSADINEFIKKIIICIENPEIYSSISLNAMKQFKNKSTYSESMNDYLIDMLKKN